MTNIVDINLGLKYNYDSGSVETIIPLSKTIKKDGDYMKRDYSVSTTADKIHRKKLFSRISKVILLLLLLLFSVSYSVLYVVYNTSNFSISVDKDMLKSSIFLTEDGSLENKSRSLSASAAEYMDNISVKWISEDVDTEANGAHNGTNYVAYSFYLVHNGENPINYWYEIDVDDTIKNLDESIRVMIYHNGEKKIYAKPSKKTGDAEKDTVKFYSTDIAVLEERKNFSPGDKDHFTVVIWIEGDDPECKNDLLGGGIKMHMDITEERIVRK